MRLSYEHFSFLGVGSPLVLDRESFATTRASPQALPSAI
jgi:hypothetical protein